jgi:hypothetical protein
VLKVVAYLSLRVELRRGQKRELKSFLVMKQSYQPHSSQGVFSPMSRAFSQAKLKGEERRAILQTIQTQMQQVIIDGVTQVLQEFLEQEVTTKLGRPKLASTLGE